MRILIDADGCPVTKLTLRIAARYGIECVLFCDTAHSFDTDARVITVSQGADSADFALVNHVLPGDIVVTQDYGLAAMALARGARPISQDGMLYTDGNIGGLLESRALAKRIRRGGGRLKGPSKRTSAQDTAFEAALLKLLGDKNA
ncbi:MAG: DUF188 domain-containing protein [Clostridia bacterium]|nr:DUF188 domain-containing protein [Clostridia bacterium]